MRKFIFIMIAMLTVAFTANAQQTNYAGSSKFTDNWSATVQAGTLTTFDNFYSGHTAMAPIVVIGADKYINPWLGVGIDARTLIGTGNGYYNTKTVFDAVNVSGLVKFNVLNMLNYNGTRKTFEPVVYTGLGWGQYTALKHNYMTYRAGTEFNINLGKEKAWGIVINPAVVWGDINNGKLIKSHGNFELTAGVVYHFKTSNGSRAIAKAKLYDEDVIARNANEIARLTNRVAELESRKPQVKTVEKIVEKEVPVLGPGGTRKYIVMFEFNSSALSNEAKEELNKVHENVVVDIDAYASPEGNEQYNLGLSEQRKNVVKEYLENRGVKVNEARFHGAADKYSNRVAIITMVGANTDHGTGFNPHPHGEHPNGFNPHPHGTQK